MANKPKKWVAECSTEVIAYINSKLGHERIHGSYKFYGFDEDKNNIELSSDSLELTINFCRENGYTFIFGKFNSEEEEFKRGETVEVFDGSFWLKRIYLTTILGSKKPFVCVDFLDEENLKRGEEFSTHNWKEIRKYQPMKTKKEIAVEQAIELLKKEGKIVDGKVLSI